MILHKLQPAGPESEEEDHGIGHLTSLAALVHCGLQQGRRGGLFVYH